MRAFLGQETITRAERDQIMARIKAANAKLLELFDYTKTHDIDAEFGTADAAEYDRLQKEESGVELVNWLGEMLKGEAASYPAPTWEQMAGLDLWEAHVQAQYDVYARHVRPAAGGPRLADALLAAATAAAMVASALL